MVQFSCGRLQVTGADKVGFRADLTPCRFGQLQTSLIAADAHTVTRPAQWPQPEGEEFIYLCRMLDGQAVVTQDERTGLVRPGELIAFDNARPFTLAMPALFRMLVLKLPHRAIGMAPPATETLTAYSWSGSKGVSALVSPLLIGLAENLNQWDAATAGQLGCSIAAMVATLFSEQLRHSPQSPSAVRHALLFRVQAYAVEHLADPRLTPRLLAERHHISLRQLQKLFQEQRLSPAKWIRDERLRRCASDLRDPRLTHLPVAAIGERWGLAGASYFSYLFREQFAVSPQVYRRNAGVDAALRAAAA